MNDETFPPYRRGRQGCMECSKSRRGGGEEEGQIVRSIARYSEAKKGETRRRFQGAGRCD